MGSPEESVSEPPAVSKITPAELVAAKIASCPPGVLLCSRCLVVQDEEGEVLVAITIVNGAALCVKDLRRTLTDIFAMERTRQIFVPGDGGL